ncbi:MAG: carboxylating nicotinate-nucleotide diphosphorylase [Bacteroidota bacterium]|nr:carboxylating nicotinate-nucleotide diphosphorylase [Bacteroidota bacterium]
MNDFIKSALREDVGEGDHSTLAAVPEKLHSKARLLIKGDGIIAGVDLALKIFEIVDPNLIVQLKIKDGDQVNTGDVGFIVEGKAQSILTSERLVLNCMQRMSGIATLTHHLNSLLVGTNTKLLDTRKTTPNFRIMEKWAVAIGGGTNHRFGLYDLIMLKDNHVDYAGGIDKAIRATKNYLINNNKNLRIEIETRNLQEVKEVLDSGGVDIIMLDNMDLQTMKTAIGMINGQYITEASGGITEANLRQVALCGVDFISVGALTHSVKSMDISLKAC